MAGCDGVRRTGTRWTGVSRIVEGMTDINPKLGDDVDAPGGRGSIIDVRATPSGKWIYGVENATGEVSYYTSRALRPTQG